MTAIKCDNEILIIDAGLMFPEEELLGRACSVLGTRSALCWTRTKLLARGRGRSW